MLRVSLMRAMKHDAAGESNGDYRYNRQRGAHGTGDRGVAALGHRTQVNVVRAVQAFTAFTPDNDPYGEHDFGFFKAAGHEFFWKIDAYDPSLTRHSDDAADPTITVRVLTIMLTEEY